MIRREFMSLVGGAALTPLAALPALTDSHGNLGIPAQIEDGWLTAAADDDTLIDRAALRRMADRLAAASDPKIHGVVVARGGKLVFDRYFTGADEIPWLTYTYRTKTVAFDADTLHNMKSASKSIASLAVGIALDRGLIRSVEEPILSFFPELSDLRSPERDQLHLVHALTMSMGLKWVEATPDTGDFDNDEARMQMAWDPNRYVLTLPSSAPAGKEFFYNTGALRLVSAIIHRASGRYLDEFARETIFEPLGITHLEWSRPRGETDAGGGLRLRPRDMAKIGQLVLNGGRWNDRQIVSKTWIEVSTSPKLRAVEGLSYGYLWWLGSAAFKGRAVQYLGAFGRGGQYIRIVPELDLVVAVTAGYYQDYSPQAFQAQYDVFKKVLGAVSARA